ncbi:hypothetical protein [Dyella choica]|uniref:Uncharacterized protein n=1 Tax=Dyella choica TaxID=1927959 RepID=A0A3S0WXV0_9GAMM|nr:hypothetical protein [Dyella choica]RUL78382.1 hypothetical protein EKH80_06055 [Dyella choica]
MTITSLTVQVPSCMPWVATALEVDKGDRLIFASTGTWVDAFIPCTAEGYPAPLFYAFNHPPRVRDADRYFRLMGCIVADGKEPGTDDLDQAFPIGRSAQLIAQSTGMLFVFANDREGYYWNNWGQVQLAIQRIRP